MNRRTYSLWNKYENLLGARFPKELKFILNICGFDTELSIAHLNNKIIEEIENIVNENITNNNVDLISVLKNTLYEKKSLPFRFLLGHKLLLLSLPEQITLKKRNSEIKKTKKIREEKPILSAEEHKKKLFLRLKNYANKYDLNFTIDQNNIKKFSVLNKIAQCVVKCCFCEVEIPCTFVSYWHISNFIRHIRGHLQNSTQIGVANNTEPNSDTRSKNLEKNIHFERSQVDVLKKVQSAM